jgi:TolA-binding protein
VFFQTAFAHQQLGNDEEALKLYGQVAGKYRDETAARSRFMMGEVYFARRDLAKAIPEFQRVMYGFGADKAPDGIKNWQAKSGYEAGRCAELLIQSTDGARKQNAIKYARQFFGFVVEKHPQHELAGKAQERLEVLKRL